jgi:hypothetical protein
MHLDELILYNAEGETRTIGLKSGKLNVITGDSRTGKSSLVNIIRYLLGSGRPNTPHGPIRDSVAWYAMRAHIGETAFFVARPSVSGESETSEAMMLIGEGEIPELDELKANTTNSGMRDYFGGLLGIEDNQNVPALGQTRRPLSATFVHSLYYCFQGQGEIANPDILFHRQNREWIPQTIRDTLPYFLGAQGADDLRQREELTAAKRELKRLRQRLSAAEAELSSGLERAGSLIAEAVEVGLLAGATSPTDTQEAKLVLQQAIDSGIAEVDPGENAGEFERLRPQRAALLDEIRNVADQIRSLDAFAAADSNYRSEVTEQSARLASIGLVPEEGVEANCVVCGQSLGEEAAHSHEAVSQALDRSNRRLDLAERDRPRIQSAREALTGRRTELQENLRDLDLKLEALASLNERASNERDRINLQSYVRGRIAQYLEQSAEANETGLDELRALVEEKGSVVEDLASRLDANAVRSRTTSLLRSVSKSMTEWAQELGLEHAADGVQIDLDRLTVVADTPRGPAYMDSGDIGSGMNWVGYHLTAYLALQTFFIKETRPVPSFLLLDQPSQAFFPRDQEAGGDFGELDDTDRENTKKLYELTHQVVEQLDGKLQVLALDHADFEDPWFSDSVVQRWRGGEALIPSSWHPEA